MILRRALLGLAAAGACAAPLAAQPAPATPADKARLDEFALPAPAARLRVEQVTTGPAAPPPAQAHDRTLAQPARTEPAGRMPVQVSTPAHRGEVGQLATRQQSRTALAGAPANPKDRLPAGVQHIGGVDRCDPAQERAAYAECLRILELRANEFHAPEAPTLSPEQRLLGEMRTADERLTGPAARMRSVANGQLNADLESDQELAALVLPQTGTPQAPAKEPEKDDTSRLSEVLQAIGIQVVVPPTTGN